MPNITINIQNILIYYWQKLNKKYNRKKKYFRMKKNKDLNKVD